MALLDDANIEGLSPNEDDMAFKSLTESNRACDRNLSVPVTLVPSSVCGWILGGEMNAPIESDPSKGHVVGGKVS